MRDLTAAAVDVAGAAIVVAERVVPETEPVLGVAPAIGEQRIDQPLALVGTSIVDERRHLRGRRQQANHVEIHAPHEPPIARERARRDLVLLEVRREQPIDRMRRGLLMAGHQRARRKRRKFDVRRMQIARRNLREVDLVGPRRALIDPGAQHANLRGLEPRALLRHHVVGVEAGDEVDQQAVAALARQHGVAAVAAFHHRRARLEAEPAARLAAPVTADATRIEDRDDVPREVDRIGSGRRKCCRWRGAAVSGWRGRSGRRLRAHDHRGQRHQQPGGEDHGLHDAAIIRNWLASARPAHLLAGTVQHDKHVDRLFVTVSTCCLTLRSTSPSAPSATAELATAVILRTTLRCRTSTTHASFSKPAGGRSTRALALVRAQSSASRLRALAGRRLTRGRDAHVALARGELQPERTPGLLPPSLRHARPGAADRARHLPPRMSFVTSYTADLSLT